MTTKKVPAPRLYQRVELDEDEVDTVSTDQNEQEVVDEQPEPEQPDTPTERPTDNPGVDWKKRYSDLKSHYDKTVPSLRNDIENLREELQNMQSGNGLPEIPKSKEALEKWRGEYPEAYEMVLQVAAMAAKNEVGHVDGKMKQILREHEMSAHEAAKQHLLTKHPDFLELIETDVFKEWLDVQPVEIQGWLKQNKTDATKAIKAIDIFKSETGYGKKKPSKPVTPATAVSSPRTREQPQTGGKKVWKVSEIEAGMRKPGWYDKHEAEIDEAYSEGRIIDE